MNNKTFVLFFLLFTAFFAETANSQTPQQKDKNKEKEAKSAENKAQEKAIAVVKIDTANSRIRNVITEIDSFNILDFKLKFLKKNAHASYYHHRFNGRRTASGKTFNNNKYTAAHKKLPFGTKVRVTNEANGKSVIVEITDRGPFSKTREIDLSRRAFMDIASNKNSGVVNVTIEVIEAK